MRPGPIRPGDVTPSVAWGCICAGFNEARADSPGRYDQHTLGRRPEGIASMRPGPIRPGDNLPTSLPFVVVEASMRPGPIRPGDVADPGT